MIDVNFDFTMDTDGYWDGFWTETGDFATDKIRIGIVRH